MEIVMLLRHSTNILPGTTSGQVGRADPTKNKFCRVLEVVMKLLADTECGICFVVRDIP